jgi:HK97 family phage prohead protease
MGEVIPLGEFKSYYADFQVKEFDEEAKVLTFRGTTEDSDRSGDIVVADGGDFKNYSKNPLFLWAHDHSGATLPIGKALSVDKISGVGADFKIQFDAKDPFAMEVYRKYKEGYLHAVSVGFIAHKAERRLDDSGEPMWPPAYKYLEWELLELSGVPIPANPNALRNAYKQFEEFMSYTGNGQSPEEVMQELLQSNKAEEVKHSVEDCKECAKKDLAIGELQTELDTLKDAHEKAEAEAADFEEAQAADAEKNGDEEQVRDTAESDLRERLQRELGLTVEEAVALLVDKADTSREEDPTEQIAQYIDERLQYLAGKAWK